VHHKMRFLVLIRGKAPTISLPVKSWRNRHPGAHVTERVLCCLYEGKLPIPLALAKQWRLKALKGVPEL
jgi:hypothetical protein